MKGSAPVVTIANDGGEGWRESCLTTVRRGAVAVSECMIKIFVAARPMAGAKRL